MAATPTLLQCLEPLIKQGRGARFEADVFSALFRDPTVIRAFEFAPVDGVLDCSEGSTARLQSFADRYWELNDALRLDPDSATLVPFDVKSSSSFAAQDQTYLANNSQCHNAAFFICICAADPAWVELYPNLRSPPPADVRYVKINTTRTPLLCPSAYGMLNPCGAPFRMPLSLLPEALRRIRAAALNEGDFVNPWTQVRVPNWKPKTLSSGELLRPAVSSEHFTAYMGVMDLWHAFRNAAALDGVPARFDFVHLQPRLADFKLIVHGSRQVLVQYKIDGRDRAIDNALAEVAIARGSETECRWYFSAFDRFDFLLYEFSFSNRPSPSRIKEAFFIPERCLPEHFYTTHEVQADFGIPAFEPYRIRMDTSGGWVRDVFDIIARETHPRRAALPPARADANPSTTALAIRSGPQKERLETRSAALTACHQSFFRNVLAECARRRSGLVAVVADGHPMGDFVFCNYRWSQGEVDGYLSSGKPPKVLHELPAATPVVCMYAHAKAPESNYRGPGLTSPQFRRLHSSLLHRLLVFDPLRPEAGDVMGPVYIVPSEDMSATQDQLQLHASNLVKKKNKGFANRTPLVSELLHSGRAVSDYVACGRGPLLFDDEAGDGWSGIWDLLDRFAGVEPFEYPASVPRHPATYRATVRQLHERLVEEMARELS